MEKIRPQVNYLRTFAMCLLSLLLSLVEANEWQQMFSVLYLSLTLWTVCVVSPLFEHPCCDNVEKQWNDLRVNNQSSYYFSFNKPFILMTIYTLMSLYKINSKALKRFTWKCEMLKQRENEETTPHFLR